MNCLKHTLLIIKAQVVCTKNQARQETQRMSSNRFNLRGID